MCRKTKKKRNKTVLFADERKCVRSGAADDQEILYNQLLRYSKPTRKFLLV